MIYLLSSHTKDTPIIIIEDKKLLKYIIVDSWIIYLLHTTRRNLMITAPVPACHISYYLTPRSSSTLSYTCTGGPTRSSRPRHGESMNPPPFGSRMTCCDCLIPRVRAYDETQNNKKVQQCSKGKKNQQGGVGGCKSKRTTLRIPTWSPTVVLTEPEGA